MKKSALSGIVILGLGLGFAQAGENAHKCNANRCGGDQSKLLINGNKDVKKPVKKEAKKQNGSSDKKEAKK